MTGVHSHVLCRLSGFVITGAAAFLLSSCLTQSGAPLKPIPEEEPVPYESVAAYLAVGDPQAALDRYDASQKEKPKSRETRILHARLLMITGKLDEAREEFNLLLSEDASDAAVLYGLSIIEGLESNRKAQKELLERTIAADPGHADALSALGDLCLEDKEYDKAKKYFDQALKIDQGNFVALLGQGAVLLQNKDYARASQTYTQAIQKEPAYSFAYVDRARARKALGDSPGAITDLSEAIALDPEYSWSYLDRGKLYLDRGKMEEALEDFSAAIALDPRTFSAFALRAEIFYRRGEYDKALSDYNSVAALKPGYYFIYEPLGVIHYMKKDYSGAAAAFAEAHRYQKDEHTYALLAGLSLRRQGKPKEAEKYLQEVLPRIPREAWPYDVCRFLLDPVSGDIPLVTRIEREKNRGVRARMLFYLGSQYLIDGKIRAGQTYLLEIDGSGAPETAETRLARFELQSMEAKD